MTWTEELNTELASKTIRQFAADHPEFSSAAIHIQRRRLRDKGWDLIPSPIGRIPDPVVEVPPMSDAPDEEEYWDNYRSMQKLLRKHNESKSQRYLTIPVKTNRKFGISFWSDLHLGSLGTDFDRLREDIALVNTCPHLKVFMGGDGIDNFIIRALSHVNRDEDIFPTDVEYTLFRFIMQEMFQSLLVCGSGNHDAWTKKLAGIDANLTALYDVPVMFTGEDTYLTLIVGNVEYVIYRKHKPIANSKSNYSHGIQQAYRFGEMLFDVGVTEHLHVPTIATFEGHGKERIAITTGSYKVEDNYAIDIGATGGGIGTPTVVFDPHTRMMTPFKRLHEAIEFLEIP